MDKHEDSIPESGRNSWIDHSSASDDGPLTADSVNSSLEIDMSVDQKMSCSDSERVTPAPYFQEKFADPSFEVSPREPEIQGGTEHYS